MQKYVYTLTVIQSRALSLLLPVFQLKKSTGETSELEVQLREKVRTQARVLCRIKTSIKYLCCSFICLFSPSRIGVHENIKKQTSAHFTQQIEVETMKANMGVSYKAQMAKLVEVSLFGKKSNLVNDPEQ